MRDVKEVEVRRAEKEYDNCINRISTDNTEGRVYDFTRYEGSTSHL